MKKFFYVLLMLCAVCVQNTVQAQSPALLFKVGSAINSSSSSRVEHSAIDAAGNIYVTGSIEGSVTFGSTTLVSDGDPDIFIAKYNSAGVVQWAKRAGGQYVDVGYGIAVADNAVYITGLFTVLANFNTPSATGSNEISVGAVSGGDIFLAKYDDAGNFQWAKRAGGISTGTDEGYGIAVSGTDVFVTGYFNGTINFNTPFATGSNEITANGNNSDIFIAKYNTSGDFQWAKRAGSTDGDQAQDIAVSGSDIYITGNFRQTANFNSPSAAGSNEITSAGRNDIFIAKYDNAGNFQWAKRAGSASDDDRGQGLSISGSIIYLTGFFGGTADFNTPSSAGTNEISSAGYGDIFLAQYDNSGNVNWVKRAGGTDFDLSYGVTTSSTGSVYITGAFGETTNFNTPSAIGSNEIVSAGGSDMFVAKYNSSGEFKWAQRGGGANYEDGLAILTSGTSIYAGGYFNSIANFNTPSATGTNELTSAYQDGYIAKYDDIPTVGITASPSNAITLGTSVTFTASSFNGGSAPTYQWTKNGSNVGTSSTTYTDGSLANNDVIVCTMTSNYPEFLSVTATSNSITMVVTGPPPGTALNFDGTNDYVALPNALATAVTTTSSTAITIEYWVKGTNTQSAVRLQNGGNYIVAGYGGTGHIISTDGGGSGVTMGTSNVNDGNWHHVAMTWQKNTVNGFKSYVDGVLVNQRTSANVNLPAISSGAAIGCYSIGLSEFMNGSIDEVRIWTVARTAIEIANSRNCELVGNETGLAAYYKFNQGLAASTNTGLTSLTGSAPNAYNGTLTNFALTDTTSNWITSTNSFGTSVTPSISIAANPSGAIEFGTSVTFTATPTNGGTTPQYQWKKNGSNVGSNLATYTDAALINNDAITCVLTSSATCASPATVTSNTITITASIPPFIGATVTNACAGANGAINITLASGALKTRYIRINQNNNDYLHLAEVRAFDLTGTNVALGKTVTSLSIFEGNPNANLVDNNVNTLGHSANAGTSEFLEIDLGAEYVLDYVQLVNRANCCQDRAQNLQLILKNGSNTVVNSRTVNAYQNSNTGLVTTWNVVDINWTDGATTLNRANLAAATYTINYTDINNTAQSLAIEVSAATPVTPSVSIAANPSGAITSGTSVTFTATPTNGGTTPQYQWKKNGNNVGTNLVTYTDAALANNDVITCVLTSNATCVSPATATSTGITMTVTGPTTYTWTGTTSTDWATTTNWTPNGIPSSTDNVIIPTTTNKPMLPANQTIANLSLTGTNKVMLGSSTLCVNAITGGSASSYIVTDGTGGLIIKALSTSTPTTFPIGASETSYDPLSIRPTNSVDITAKVKTVANAGGFSGTIANFTKVVPRQWDITPSANAGSTVLTLTNGGTTYTPTTPKVGHYNFNANNTWEELAATHSNGTWTAITTSFSPFGVGDAGGFLAAVLPVELLDFKATPSVSGNLLTWTTANEVNNKGFEVQRLATNGHWSILGFVNANGKSSTYNFTDNSPLITSYYRLRQIDNDGKETFSKVISVSSKGSNKLKVYPNPVSNTLTIETDFVLAPNEANRNFQIFNLLGQQVLNGKAARQIDVSALPQGSYFLKVGTEQVKFIKQ